MARTRTIGSRLRDLRKELRLTQVEFAERFGISARAAQSYERDEVLPSAQFLQKLAESNIDLNELLTGRILRRSTGSDAQGYSTVVTPRSKIIPQAGELDVEILKPVLQSTVEQAKGAKDIDWLRTAQRFASAYARHYGEKRGSR